MLTELRLRLRRNWNFENHALILAAHLGEVMPITPAILPRSADEVVNAANFFSRVLPLYEKGVGDIELEADLDTARSVVPAGSGGPRDFSFIAPEIPEF